MSYFSDNEIMGGIGFGNDEFDGSRLDDMDAFNPYSPIQNEPMGRSYAPNNFNSSNPAVRNNYKYNGLSTYDVDTDAIYSNHMYGNPSFYRDRDALYGNATPDPQRNSFNVEQDFMQDSIDYQAPGFKSTADRRYNKAGGLEKSGKSGKERFSVNMGEQSTINMFLIFLIIVVVIFAYMQIKQNHEIMQMIKTILLHQIHAPRKDIS